MGRKAVRYRRQNGRGFLKRAYKAIKNRITGRKKQKAKSKKTKRMKTPWDNSIYGNPHTIVQRLMRPRY